MGGGAADAAKKYQQISARIREQIRNGALAPGVRIATERELAALHGVSRPTVTHALNDLAAEGLIRRRVGAGSFVVDREHPDRQLTFGLLVPGLGRGEIFEPVCARIAKRAAADRFTLNWGGSTGTSYEQLLQTVDKYLAQGVDGIFFQPVELDPSRRETNRAVLDRLHESRTPVVLLDADYLPFPDRSGFDIVGIDNIRAAWTATAHLTAQGATRVDFMTRPHTATTVERRIDGYRLALLAAGIVPSADWEHSLDPEHLADIERLLASGARDIVCVNDETAALLLPSLETLGVGVPREVHLIGFDDVKYARLVRVPLTTLRQPCDALGDAAVDAMLGRVAQPDRAPREILLEAELMVRTSSSRASVDA